MESTMIASGLGYAEEYTDYRGNKMPTTHNNIRVIRLYDFYLNSGDMDAKIRSWNMQVHVWLKNYVFNRMVVTSKDKSNYQFLPHIITKMTAAVWHGIEPGFFNFFFGVFQMQYSQRVFWDTWMYHYIKKLGIPDSILYQIGN